MTLLRLATLLLVMSLALGTGGQEPRPRAPSMAKTAAPGIGVSFPRGIIAFEKLYSLLKASGGFIYIPVEQLNRSTGTLLLLGPSTSRLQTPAASRVIEMFHGGPPLRKGHEVLPFLVGSGAWCRLFSRLRPRGPGGRPLVILATPRTRAMATGILERCSDKGITPRVKVVTSEDSALAYIGKLFKVPTPPWGLQLTHDLETLSPKVLELALRLQYRRGILLFVRTRHEVLAGGIAAWEPLYSPQDLNSWLTGHPVDFPEQLFYNPLVVRALEVREPPFKALGGKPKSW